MSAAVRTVMLAIALLALGNAAQASCDANGNITGVNAATIVLGTAGCATAPGVTSATVVSGATVTAAGTGVASVASPDWAVTNHGSITVTGNAVTGDVSFTLTNSGTMSAGLSGALLGGGSTVVNSVGGTITGKFTGLSISANGGSIVGGSSTVDNAGTISSATGFNTAIVLGLGGTVTNRSTGTISANGVGVAGATNPTVVNNSGQILDASTGIGLSAGGSVTNDLGAVINAQSRGIDIAGGGGTVINSGGIVANFGRAVQLQAGGSVTNTSTGTITSAGGGTRAIFVFGGPSTIVNAGSVKDGTVAAIEVESTQSSITNSGTIGTAFGAGIQLDGTSASNTLTTIANNAGGTIQGATNALVTQGNASVDFTNKGSIIGDMVFGAGDASLHFYTGSSLIGNLTAGTGTNAISFNGSGSGTFSNPIANFQTINKQDSGTWTLSGVVSGATAVTVTQGKLGLSGANTYTGATTVNGGKLVVNGSILSPTTVNNGGTLGGTGVIGNNVTALGGGILAPGNSIGALTVNGGFTLSPSAIYEVEANAQGQADKVIVNGTVNLTGSVLRVLAANGTYKPKTEYLIVDNDGGDAVTGKFASVTTNLAFLSPSVVYNAGDGNDVVLTLSASSTADFCSVATTKNQCNVANALNKFPADDPLFLAVLNQTAAGARQAFNALSGEIHATVPGLLADESRYVREAVLGRLMQASYTNGVGEVASLGAAGPQVASLDNQAMALGYDDKSFAPLPSPGPAFWTRAFGAWGNFDGNGNARRRIAISAVSSAAWMLRSEVRGAQGSARAIRSPISASMRGIARPTWRASISPATPEAWPGPSRCVAGVPGPGTRSTPLVLCSSPASSSARRRTTTPIPVRSSAKSPIPQRWAP